MILLARVLGEWAIAKGMGVLSTETHGMATRGGSVLTQVKIGNFYSPMVMKGCGDLGISMHPQEEEKAREYLKEGAPCVVNTGNASSTSMAVDASEVSAKNLGTPLYSNLVMAGFVGSRFLGASFEDLSNALSGVTSKRLEENLKALRLGFEYKEG